MEHADLGNGIDKRIRERHSTFSRALLFGRKVSIQSISRDRAEQIGSYRLLHNPRLTEELLIDEIRGRCSRQVEGKVVLCLHDTSEANFFRHRGRLKNDTGLGPIDAAKKGIGFKIHDSIAVDAKSFYPYGICHIDLWKRNPDRVSKAWKNRKKPVSEKESSKWQRGCTASEEALAGAAAVVHVQDREGDLYDQLAGFTPGGRIFHIIRSRYDRTTVEKKKVSSMLDQAPILGSYLLEIPSDGHSGRKRRIAELEVRAVSVELVRPQRASGHLPRASGPVTVLLAKEKSPPSGIEPLKWQLLTSCNVSGLADALQVVEWYSARWSIEEFYRILKKENFDIESSELESGWALRKLSIMTMDTSLKVLQILYCREMIDEGETLRTVCSFSELEFECLSKLNSSLQGRTEKQKNPFPERSAQWTIWILSRLGGWMGYGSQRKPGATTILNGLQKFYQIYSGYEMKIDVCTR